ARGRGDVYTLQDEESTLAPPPYGGGGRGGEATVEPHIWNSAANAQIIARNILHALIKMDEAGKMDYIARFKQLSVRIERTDSLIRQKLSAPDADRAFMIYHPALSYFARDYGLHQISIEADGKEPSPAHLKELINACKQEKVRIVFVQPEFDRRNAELIARQTGAQVVGINPLAYDWEEEMMKVAGSLSSLSSPVGRGEQR
uniref:metal ABC transporter solute-binding protein, Zn/Mn family n=1 Tax=uncultured Bacteroides sp. TaxID=162156 RepID=UPI002610755F